jgi:photosystem II stability/assembly factor-like uncharacterized protein
MALHAGRTLVVIGLVAVCATSPSVAGINRWTQSGPQGGSVPLVRIDPVTPSTVYAVADRALYRSTDGGVTWSERTGGLPVSSKSFGMDDLVIDPGSPSTLIAIAAQRLWKSTDAGLSWSPRTIPLPAYTAFPIAIGSLLATDPVTPGTFYLAYGAGGQVYRSTDAGDTWAALGVKPGPASIPTLTGFAINPFTPSTFYAVLFDGVSHVAKIFRSTNSGSTWVAGGSGFPAVDAMRPLILAPTNPVTLYLRTSGAQYRSHDGGATWNQSGLGQTDIGLIAVDPSAPTTLYALDGIGFPLTGPLIRSTDDGATWNTLDTAIPRLRVPAVTALAVDPTDSTRLYAGTAKDGVIRSVDTGASWSLQSQGLSPKLNLTDTLVEPGPQASYAVSSPGVVWKSLDGGDTWAARNPDPVYTGTFTEFLSLAMDPATAATLYLGSNQRGVFKSLDRAETWTPVNTGLSNLTVRAIAVDPQAPATIYAATSGGVFKSTNGAASWTPASADTTINHLVVDPTLSTRLYANRGELVSTDAGMTFVQTGVFAAASGTTVSAAATAIAPHPLVSGTVFFGWYAVSFSGSYDVRLRKSIDGMATGNAAFPLPTGYINALAYDPGDANTLWASVSSFPNRSRDGGTTYANVRSGLPSELSNSNVASTTSFAVDPLDPAVLMSTFGLGLFRLDLPPCAVAADCDDGNPCTTDSCAGTVCVWADVPNNAPCNDTEVCPYIGTCSNGACFPAGGSPAGGSVCNDFNSCTVDYCLTSGTCDHVPNCAPPVTSTTSTSSTTSTTIPCADGDGDGVCTATDNCPADPNPNQRDLDGDLAGDVCDPSDAPLGLTVARVRAGAGTGSVLVKGRAAGGPSGPLDVSGGASVEVSDGIALTVSYAWAAGECQPRGVSFRCRSADGRAQATFSPERGSPPSRKVLVRLKRLTLVGPFGAPVTATISETGTAVDRVDAIAACTVAADSLRCREP